MLEYPQKHDNLVVCDDMMIYALDMGVDMKLSCEDGHGVLNVVHDNHHGHEVHTLVPQHLWVEHVLVEGAVLLEVGVEQQHPQHNHNHT